MSDAIGRMKRTVAPSDAAGEWLGRTTFATLTFASRCLSLSPNCVGSLCKCLPDKLISLKGEKVAFEVT